MKACLILISLFACLVLLVGCLSIPPGTVGVDLDNDGDPEFLAQDADRDGQPDLDVDGEIIKVDKGLYHIGSMVDPAASMGLIATGTAFGIPAITALGLWWRKSRLTRMIGNLVASVQSARKTVARTGGAGVLTAMDDALTEGQLPDTVKEILRLKIKMGIGSVPPHPTTGET